MNRLTNWELLPTSGIRAGLSAITPGWGCHSACQSALSELPASLSCQCMHCMRYNPFTTEFCVLQLCRENPNPCHRFVCALFCVGANNSMLYPNSSTWRPSFSVINNPRVCHWKPAWRELRGLTSDHGIFCFVLLYPICFEFSQSVSVFRVIFFVICDELYSYYAIYGRVCCDDIRCRYTLSLLRWARRLHAVYFNLRAWAWACLIQFIASIWYNLLLVSWYRDIIYFNLLLTLIRSHTFAWRLLV